MVVAAFLLGALSVAAVWRSDDGSTSTRVALTGGIVLAVVTSLVTIVGPLFVLLVGIATAVILRHLRTG